MQDKYKVINSIIDTVAFYVGNYAVHSVAKTPAPHMRHTVLFLIADFIVRSGYLTHKEVYEALPEHAPINLRQDTFISLLYVLLGSAYDAVAERGNFGSVIKNNVIFGAVGLGTNLAVDYFIPITYK